MTSVPGSSRRDVLKATAGAAVPGGASAAIVLGSAVGVAAAAHDDHRENLAETVDWSDDAALIEPYQPQFVLEGVDPEPIGFYALHAEHENRDLAAVYGFTRYPYQAGNVGRTDSHYGDHEPIIVFYDTTTGEVARVLYAAYHWFRGTALPKALTFADDQDRRPVFRVDPDYHHYYIYDGPLPGRRLEVRSLLDYIGGWLDADAEGELALSQPWDPWDMLGRESWWRHTTGNWIQAVFGAIWFNIGISGATETADVEEVSAW